MNDVFGYGRGINMKIINNNNNGVSDGKFTLGGKSRILCI